MFIAVSFGLSLLVNAWVFYRITGGLFNPAITFALWLIGGLNAFRAVLLFIAQLAGGIAGAALVAALTPFGGVENVTTVLSDGVNAGQGLFIEAFLTAILVLTVLFLAAEKHKATHLAPIGIGLVLLACHLFGVAWTGCGINPARSLGPAVVTASFPRTHWVYWIGPLIGSLMAVGFYLLLKAFDYSSVAFGQDADHEIDGGERHVVGSALFSKMGKKLWVVYPPPPVPAGTDSEIAEKPEVVEFDARNMAMQEALRDGNAHLLDPEMGTKPQGGHSAVNAANESRRGSAFGAAPALQGGMDGHATPGHHTVSNTQAPSQPGNGVPSMRASAQDVGGLNVPGTHNSGFAIIPVAANVLRS